jgi:transposase-like protein
MSWRSSFAPIVLLGTGDVEMDMSAICLLLVPVICVEQRMLPEISLHVIEFVNLFQEYLVMKVGVVQRRYSESFKIKVVEELESGELSMAEARREYGIMGGSTLPDWCRQYGTGQKREVLRVTMKSEKDRIQELERALSEERLGTLLLSAQLRSYHRHAPDLKKKLSSKELKKFEENEEKLKSYL